MREPTGLSSAETRAEQLAAEVAGLLDDLFDTVEPLAATVREAMAASTAGQAGPAIREALASPCHDILFRSHGIPLSGVGFVAEHGVVLPDRSWMAWWVRRDEGIRQKGHNLNPASDAFYDYTTAPWFRLPRRTGERHIAGPYIDSWGTDDVTITASAAVRTAGRFVGVVAADLAVRRFEVSISAQLRSIGVPAVLVNDEDRVVASGVPELTTGLRLQPRARAAAEEAGLRRFPGRYGWSVVLRS